MLNNLLKKAIIDKGKTKHRDINVKTNYLFISLGIRIMMIYLFFIFLVGKYLAILLNLNDLYLFSVFIATIINIYIIRDVIKKNK